ncbi:MAG: DUF58 domain-containing protein [FCB group bacterium]|nr:DUF58 domain-containing protein [FCB group bacterium]
MKAFPAIGLVAYAAALAVLSGALLFVPGLLPYLVAAALLVVAPVAWDFFWLHRMRKQITARLTVPETCVRGDTIRVELDIENAGRSRVRFRVRPVLPPEGQPSSFEAGAALGPEQRARFTIDLHTPVRGEYRFDDIYLRLQAPLRTVQAQIRVPVLHFLRVYPDVRRVKDYIVSRRTHAALAPHIQTSRVRGLGSEFESLRDYEDGDDIRRIDWRATARHSKLITRNYEIEHFRDILIVVDRGRLMAGRVGEGTKLDHALDAALMAAGVALDGGDRCGLLVFDDDVISFLPPRGGMDQLQRIVQTVYDVQPTLVESHFRRAFIYLQTRLTKRSLVLVLSDVSDVDASAAVLTGLLALGRRHLVIMAALRTPEIEGVLEERPTEAIVPYRKAVAYRLIRERAEVLARLEKGGILVLDVPPDQLTIPVVNKYIEVREANRL